ncbi:hypothetical protein AGABI1DRAFT_115879 [Agaricus bisporus var. burnettii JB137-S8]|uniref:F-box domain-containing protein n=1 Tax=Agaricus bisporus var. burnettii (strain JB137-S8 / ATCC MYA-4627 / FGSC 10392) TaxID=597362 RepID=K5WZN5_AGABU|nr:uncharacterized protein AGABI1DRAFT_115879 [Agaricus bisporus var. burnettii JB137-S8]EKM76308.1 hypothetical protein AGABI1DRAFT_115879 [Agaricus bisporus var. burnettii JB137-S8]
MLTDVCVSSTLLPYDLERSIIEFAAELDQSMAAKLSLISREAKRWVEPILYRNLTLHSSSQADVFIRTLNERESKPSASIASTIKSVSFTYGVTLHQAVKILSICTSITRLASRIQFSQIYLDMSLDDIFDFGRFLTTPLPTLRRLSVTLQPPYFYPEPNFHFPLFQNLTHLSIFGATDHCHIWSWKTLDSLLHLTHFAIELDTSKNLQTIYNLLPRFPESLRACLVVITTGDGKSDLGKYINDNHEVQQMIMGNTDRRIVVGMTEQLECALRWSRLLVVVQMWGAAYEDEDAWTRVENIINTRKQCGGGTRKISGADCHVHIDTKAHH